MMKKALLILSTLFVFGCAKNRDVERVRAGDKENEWLKSSFIGEQDGGERTQWFGKMTAIETSDSPAGHAFVGFQGEVKMGYFDFTETKLQFRSLTGLYKGKESQNVKDPVILNWSIKHVDYALDESDGQTMNKEIKDNFKLWDQKKQFRIEWEANLNNEKQMMPTTAVAEYFCWTPASVRQVEKSMKIEPDHIGFKVEVVYQQNPLCAGKQQWNDGDFNFTVTYMYSFRKVVPSDYQTKFYAGEEDPARYKYGHFQTVRTKVAKNGQPENVFMENRWPEKTHYFYFVKGFPQQYKWIWDHNNKHTVLGQTNALFKSMGSKLRFEIYDYNYNHETKKADGPEREFGDMRYSFINFIEEIEPGGSPFGYGPSDANPMTGEILAANTMVWTGMLGFYADLMQKVANDAADKSTGEAKVSSLFLELNAALNMENVDALVSSWDQSQGVGQVFKNMADEVRYVYPGWNSYTSDENGEVMLLAQIEKFTDGKPEMGSMNSSVSSEKIGLPLSKVPFQFNKRYYNGQTQLQVKNPMDVFQLGWLEEFSNHSKGIKDVLAVLQNLEKATDKNFQGEGSLNKITDEYFTKKMHNIQMNQEGHCIIDMEEFASGFANFLQVSGLDLSDPAVREDVFNTVLYRVSIHEFGHNLNLRHNFYGSVDKENFAVASHAFPDSNGLRKMTRDGKALEGAPRVQISSSVMDYLRLEDEINTPWSWEDYDIAALASSYAPKFDDKGKLYLNCTDEHTLTSALCNRHDLGTTPSEILMSQIRAYDERYEIRNKRFNRATWNTSGYQMQVLEAMMSVKEFLPLWRSGFAEDIVFDKMQKMGINNKHIQSAHLEELNREMRNVMKISIAFYQAVVAQSKGDRDYYSKYTKTGALDQIGIMPDKIFAMLMLAGDDAIFFNPNRIMLHNSYLTYSREGDLSEFTDQIWRNTVTNRNFAMPPWFINFSRALYAKNSTNFDNRDAASLVNKLKVVRVDNAKDLLDQYGIKMEVSQPAVKTVLPKSSTSTFFPGDEVVIVHVDGYYYMTAVGEGDYTYALFQEALNNITGSGDDTASLQQFNMDVRELYWLYNAATLGAL